MSMYLVEFKSHTSQESRIPLVLNNLCLLTSLGFLVGRQKVLPTDACKSMQIEKNIQFY